MQNDTIARCRNYQNVVNSDMGLGSSPTVAVAPKRHVPSTGPDSCRARMRALPKAATQPELPPSTRTEAPATGMVDTHRGGRLKNTNWQRIPEKVAYSNVHARSAKVRQH